MASVPSKKPEDAAKEWEALWKRSSEVIAFMYDNEGVIESLKKKLNYDSMKRTLKDQIHEIDHLIHHHQEELIELSNKIKLKALEEGKNVNKLCDTLKDAVKKLHLEQMKKTLEMLKKECK